MLSCAALSSEYAIVQLKWASQLSSVSSKQLSGEERKRNVLKNLPENEQRRRPKWNWTVSETWACRREKPVYCMWSSRVPTRLHSSYLLLSHTLCMERCSCVTIGKQQQQMLLQFSNVAFTLLYIFSYYTNIHSVRVARQPPHRFVCTHARQVRVQSFRPPKSVSAKYNSHYRKFASYNDYVLVHLYTVVQFSSGVDSSSCSLPSVAVLVLRTSHHEHMFLRRFKVLLNAAAAAFYSSHHAGRRVASMETIIKSRMHILHTMCRVFPLSQTNPGKLRRQKSKQVSLWVGSCFWCKLRELRRRSRARQRGKRGK